MGTGALVLSAPLPVRPVRQGGTGFKSESPEQPEEYPGDSRRFVSSDPSA
jgi:hypothetical protein